MKLFSPVPIGLVSLVGVVALFSLAVASDRASQKRTAPIKGEVSQARVGDALARPVSERSVSIGYMIGRNGEVTGLWLTEGNEETGLITYTLENIDQSIAPDNGPATIKPENFTQMRGTRKAMGAIASTLGQMLADQAPVMTKIKAPAEGAAKIEGVALFVEEGVGHLLTVSFEGDKPVYEEMGFVAASCNAILPPDAGACGCSAGQGGTCSGHSGTDNKYHVTCTDSQGTMSCSGSGGSCSCAATTQ